MREITIGQYIPGNSVIHRLDPRTKILITFAFMVLLFVIDDFTGYAFPAVFIIVASLLSGISLKYMIRGLRPLVVIILLTFVLNLFMIKGRVIYEVGPLDITYEGLHQGVFMVLRLVMLIVGTSLLTLTTSPITLTDGIESLLKPFSRVGVPAHELAMMMTIALRFIPTLMEETDKIMKAQMARGADFSSGNIVKRAKSLVPLLVPLFISAFRRADDLAMAMESRCYRGGENRTRMKQLRMTYADLVAFIATGLLAAGSLASRFIW
ncbi:energy-coupling factor transporter transmembrane component T family protein [Thermosediminibacter litoriperuensis]|uniref:Energy-coupling factor transporter transmembrane protein EcfT n=1 Tax=Thermosediminibacter litoriperuensis TaxID=291989 RepID=A0A5S5AL24_9FIRM|nr:energy-coupling factor transporter transmembrane component T [Thermosediminibacter litoriperuensis]TYP50338.1 energy-coupling factor transport system permease protein [Thermosediminibacter litoriperuensis]